ncbi:MAG: hypothetical protein UCO57_06605 [Gemmiger sp.]|uniref:Uncharacterized protein n=1 Tax=Subdoligranulum variabile TaxID=214851 RepID=A0A921ILA1_9FIRM|nr:MULTISPECIES: hypothetical protein [Gemmiger]MBM6898700.1 hypothetical protein [Gemmiger formicilis]MEE0708432.1 hypothetical protein [Gemmiger sp.]HJG28818.1 hypothetical protein [Subdoligranulum variabile]
MRDFLLALGMLAAGGFGWFVCCRLDDFLLQIRQDRDPLRFHHRRP